MTQHNTTQIFLLRPHDSVYIVLLMQQLPSMARRAGGSCPDVSCVYKGSSPRTAWASPISPTALGATNVAAKGSGERVEREGLTSCEISVDGLLGHTVQPLHVVLAVPDPQLLPRTDVTTGTEVNPLAVLEGHQVLFPLLPGDDDIPEGEVRRQA